MQITLVSVKHRVYTHIVVGGTQGAGRKQETRDTEMTKQEILQVLIPAARRCELVGKVEATSKQIWFLSNLLEKSDRAEVDLDYYTLNTGSTLTKSVASEWISELLSATK